MRPLLGCGRQRGKWGGGPYDPVHCAVITSEDCYPNALRKALELLRQAVAAYPTDRAYAYERLGHAAHLLADMTVPGHAHEDFADIDGKGHDAYEAWVKSTGGQPGVATPVAPVDVPSAEAIRARIGELRASGAATIPADMLGWPDAALRVYYLFYTANQRADYFDSPDYGGDSLEPYGWVDYGAFPQTPTGGPNRRPAFQTMATYLWTDAVSATASLYRLFLDEVGRFAPTVSSFAPAQGPAGTTVTITGTGFTDVAWVKFSDMSMSFTTVSPTTIRATIPAGAPRGPVTVIVPGGTATSAGEFVVTSAPSVVSFSPASGRVGTVVTISGTGLGYARSVTIGGIAAAFTVRTPTTLVATVPAGAKTGPIRVTTRYGTALSARSFYVLP